MIAYVSDFSNKHLAYITKATFLSAMSPCLCLGSTALVNGRGGHIWSDQKISILGQPSIENRERDGPLGLQDLVWFSLDIELTDVGIKRWTGIWGVLEGNMVN